MSPDTQIVPLTVALIFLSFIIIIAGFGMLYFAYRFTERAEESISAYESDHAAETVKVEAPQFEPKPLIEYSEPWAQSNTYLQLPAFHWPLLQPTERRKVAHRNLETNIGSSQNSL
jgi:hypothetical protein